MTPSFVTASLDRLRRTADRVSFLGPTLARLTVGLVFIGTGWGKLHTNVGRERLLRQAAYPGAGAAGAHRRRHGVLRRHPACSSA